MQIISNKKWDALQLQVKAMQTTAMLNQVANLSQQIFPVWKRYNDAYESREVIYSIVKKLAINAAMIPFYGYDKKGQDLPDSDKLTVFLNGLDFEQKEILYTYLFYKGEVFAYKEKIELGVNAGLSRLVFLHPDKVTILSTGGFPNEIAGYIYREVSFGDEVKIDVEDMIFIKMPNPTVHQSAVSRGLSPATVLERALNIDAAADDVTQAQLQNGGVKDIVYDESPGLSPEVIGNRRDNFNRFMASSSNKGAPYFSANKLGHIGLGSTLADMDVVSLRKEVLARACNAFGVSTILFNNDSSSTESNVAEMKKEMYTNTIIPNVVRVQDGLNRGAVPDIKTTGTIKADFSEIKELQDDESKRAEALAKRWWITGNEKRTADGYDQIEDVPLMDEIIIPSGSMLIDDLETSVTDIPNTAGDYVAPVVNLNAAKNG